jgi:predicted  nucleic acid-binding Zn-ribbon protein
VLKASSADQLRLLDVQGLDAKAAQLEHRRRTLPELAQIETLAQESAAVVTRIVVVETQRTDVGRELSKFESDIEQVRARADRDQQRLDTGAVGSAKELESLQHEIGSLQRRQNELEEAELEVMEQAEELDRSLTALRKEQTSLEQRTADAVARRDPALSDIARDLEFLGQQRAPLVGGLAADLLTLYDKLREQHGGVGAAALRQHRCEGCRLELNTTDLGRIREAADDDVLRCEECGRILVRTEESGL